MTSLIQYLHKLIGWSQNETKNLRSYGHCSHSSCQYVSACCFKEGLTCHVIGDKCHICVFLYLCVLCGLWSTVVWIALHSIAVKCSEARLGKLLLSMSPKWHPSGWVAGSCGYQCAKQLIQRIKQKHKIHLKVSCFSQIISVFMC